jgi:hypothetical protein
MCVGRLDGVFRRELTARTLKPKRPECSLSADLDAWRSLRGIPLRALSAQNEAVTDLRDRLRHVRFIGGGSGSGKSTVARRLSAEHHLRPYETETFSRYLDALSPADAPLLHAFAAMDMDERWLSRSPEAMRDSFHGFQGEGFQLVIEDLLALPRQPPVLVEGFTLLPRLVAPLLSHPQQAVWAARSA